MNEFAYPSRVIGEKAEMTPLAAGGEAPRLEPRIGCGNQC